ncbi:thioredoxin domain-containing protein, partial [Bacillus cereus]
TSFSSGGCLTFRNKPGYVFSAVVVKRFRVFRAPLCSVDENQETARQFEVMSIPALFVLKDGKVVDQALGYKPKEALVELVSKHF